MHFSYNDKTKTAIIALKVKAGSKENMIQGFIDVAGQNMLKININAAPENGKANKAIVRILANKLGLRQNQLEIIKGTTSSAKLLEIRDIEYEEMIEKLAVF